MSPPSTAPEYELPVNYQRILQCWLLRCLCKYTNNLTYSWDNQEHQSKVASLTKTLRICGENAHMDLSVLSQESAMHLKRMMIRNFKTANKIIVVLSPEYKCKADEELGGVSFEYEIILEEIRKFPKKYIFVTLGPVDPGLMPIGLGDRHIIPIEKQEDITNLLHKLRDVDIMDFGPTATVKPELTSIQIAPLFEAPKPDRNAAHKEFIVKEVTRPVISISEETMPNSLLPTDKHWTLTCFNAPAINVVMRFWFSQSENRGTKWISIGHVIPSEPKEILWVRHCDAIETVWSNSAEDSFYYMKTQNRKSTTQPLTQREFNELVKDISSNNDFVNRSLVTFIKNSATDISKLPPESFLHFLRNLNLLLS